jgi:iron(III) transport system permease protein
MVHLQHRPVIGRLTGRLTGRRSLPGVRQVWRLLTASPYVLLIALLLVPTACFLLLPFIPSAFGQGTGGFGLTPFRTAYQGYVLTALVNSLWVGLAASAAALVIAVGLAWLCERVRIAGAGAWRLGVWLLLLLPTYLTALGTEYLLAPRGVIAQATGWYPATLDHLFVGPAGVVLVLSLRGVAFAYFAVADVVRSMGTDLGDAARVHGLPRRRTVLVQVGSLTPALLAGFVLVFAETVSDFGVASTLAADAHFPVITYTIFTLTAAIPIDFPAAAAISWSLIGVFTAVLLLQRRILGNRNFSARVGTSGPPPGRTLPTRGRRIATLATGAFFTVALIGPVLGIAVSSLLGGSESSGGAVAASSSPGLTFAAYRALFATPGLLSPVWLSLQLGLAGATVAVAVGLVINLWNQYRGSRAAAVIDVGLVAVIGLPSIVLAAGFVFFYNLPAVYNALPIYNTQWLLLIGYVVGFSPLAVRMLHGPLAQAGRSLYDAARVHGSIAPGAWTKAVLPLIWRPLVSVWLFLVAVIMFELPLSEVLHAPSGEPLAVAVAVQFKSQIATGTALTVVGIAAVIAVLGAVSGLLWVAGTLHRRQRARQEAAVDSLVAGLTTVSTTPQP